MAMSQLQVVEQSQQPYIAQVAVTPDQALKAYRALQEITTKVLRKGTDYDTIPGTPKPSLLKPGAENLLRFYGLGHRVVKTNAMEDWENGFFYYEFKVTVHKTLTDGREIILAECYGSANSKEKRYHNQDAFMIVNTLQKMGIKRALVGATLQATGASGLFTQDLEDMEFDPQQAPSGSQNGIQKGSNNRANNSTGKASEKQIKAIYGISKGKNLTDEEMHAIVRGQCGVNSMKDLEKQQASDLIKLFQDTEADELKELARSYMQPAGEQIDISDDDLPF